MMSVSIIMPVYIVLNVPTIAALNRGIAEAQGKYIARMDAADVMIHERFQTNKL